MLPFCTKLLYTKMRLLLTLVILSTSVAFGKNIEVDTFLVNKEYEINEILTKLRAAEDDAEKEFINIDLQAALEELLKYPGVMEYPFESWNTMSTITSPDGAFRIFNWNVEDKNLTHKHYCYVVKPTRGNKDNKVFELKEDKVTISPKPETTLTPNNWYGALYYKIIPVQKGSKTYYTVLGFSGKDRSSNQKLLDVFYFKGKSMRMGFPLFQEAKDSKRLKRRVFFEYSEKAIFTMNQNDKIGGIVFDHLIPESPNLEGIYEFYIPDMTYDCYRNKDGIWRYEEDVIAYNDPNKKIKQWHPTEGGDSSEAEDVKDFWINPVDPTSPVNSGSDATAPIEDVRDKDTKKRNKSDRRKDKKKKHKKRKKKNRSAVTLD